MGAAPASGSTITLSRGLRQGRRPDHDDTYIMVENTVCLSVTKVIICDWIVVQAGWPGPER